MRKLLLVLTIMVTSAIVSIQGGPSAEGYTGIQITGTSSNITTNVHAGQTVQFTINAIAQGGAEIHYQFFGRSGYGEPDWGGNTWQIMQPYSTNNTVVHTFDAPGIYFIAGHIEYPGEIWSFGGPQSGIVLEVQPGPITYEELFRHGTLHEIEIIISQEEWDGHIQDMKEYAKNDLLGLGRTGKYRQATFVYRGPAGGQTIEEVGFRTKGNASRIVPQEIDDVTGEHGAFHRAHFKIKFNEKFDLQEGTDEYEERDDRRFCRLRKLDLRLNTFTPPWWDNSYIRELYSYDLLNRAGVHAPRTGSAKLYITIGGTRHYFGIYTIMEPVDKSFLTKRFGRDANDGNLYKCLFGDSGPATLEPTDSMPYWPFTEKRVIGSKDWEINYRPTYDLKTNEDEADHTVLIDFINNLNDLDTSELKAYLDENFEVERFLKSLAMNVLLGKWDNYWAMGNNYYLYFNNQGKIELIPVDFDMVLGQAIPLIDVDTVGIYEWRNIANEFIAQMLRIPLDELNENHRYRSPLVERIFEILEYRQLYEQYMIEFITPANELFVYTSYEAKYKGIYALYAPHLDNDIDEGEEMKNEGYVREYFYTRTKAVIEELGLNEGDYETSALSLDPPFGVSATDNASPFFIIVTWDPDVFGDHFSLYRSDMPDGAYELVGENITQYTYTDNSTKPSSTYYYKVKAFTSDGLESDYSAFDAGSTAEEAIPPPSGVIASSGDFNNTILVLWDAAASAGYYRVFRAEDSGGPYVQIGGDLYGTAYYDQSVAVDTPYYYKVKSYAVEGQESDFSAESVGTASATGIDGPVIIQGEWVSSGTYFSASMNMTYTFNPDGTCIKIMPNQLNPDVLDTYNGTWRSDGPGPAMDVDVLSDQGVVTVQLLEDWESPFTIDNGAKLYLVGLKQVKPDGDEVVKFFGHGQIQVIITGLVEDDLIVLVEMTLKGYQDGTWQLTTIIDDETTILSGVFDSENFQLIEYFGAYFLPVEDELLYIRQ